VMVGGSGGSGHGRGRVGRFRESATSR
jgi:hypothetical protein